MPLWLFFHIAVVDRYEDDKGNLKRSMLEPGALLRCLTTRGSHSEVPSLEFGSERTALDQERSARKPWRWEYVNEDQ